MVVGPRGFEQLLASNLFGFYSFLAAKKESCSFLAYKKESSHAQSRERSRSRFHRRSTEVPCRLRKIRSSHTAGGYAPAINILKLHRHRALWREGKQRLRKWRLGWKPERKGRPGSLDSPARSRWVARGARTLVAALPFKAEEAYFFSMSCEMTFSQHARG